jgi:NAD(P)H-hydrate epimerase
MKVLTAAEMRAVDRRTMELGIPGIVLMENAGQRVVDFLIQRFAPLGGQRIVVLCGKGNNGGDGMVIARQLHTRFPAAWLRVVLYAPPEELKGDAAANYGMLQACGCPVFGAVPPDAGAATLVIDAVLGTGVSGAPSGAALAAIGEINHAFPLAKVVAVDMPSGMASDAGESPGEVARADYTVTFTAPKLGQVMPPNCDRTGELVVVPIGSPAELYRDAKVELIEPAMFRDLLAPRPPWGHKGTFGHVLVVAGSRGKTGAAVMSGTAALRAGAGLVTVASAGDAIAAVAAHAPELMTVPLAETPCGGISRAADIPALARGKTVLAMGPGLGREPDIAEMVSRAAAAFEGPLVLDADALWNWKPFAPQSHPRILTPHPGEMARLTGKSTGEIQKDRLGNARAFATGRAVTLVLKGQRTLIAFPDGRVFVNPTGTPALGTGGTGDILTGLISGMLAQFPARPAEAVAAAVYLGGLAGQMGARKLGEKCFIATDILRYLPAAMEACGRL